MGLRCVPAAGVVSMGLVLGAVFVQPVRGESASAAALGEQAPAPAASHSVGFPWRGRLEHGVRLRTGPQLRIVEEYQPAGRVWGTAELVGMLQRAAFRVAAKHPGAALAVGDLSARQGGMISDHHSHRNGRDVDIAFYAKDSERKPHIAPTFVKFWATGKGAGPHHELVFDDARNWELVASMLEDPEARVQFIFVSETLRWRLIRAGVRAGASRETLARAATVVRRPSGRHRHKNHFHVRIFCPRDDRPRCRDRGPFWRWYDGRPPYGLYMPTRRPEWLKKLTDG